jgi:uncharacterized protein YdeI (YjbR/CyaY-like superfamily)
MSDAVYFSERGEWRRWLEKNFDREKEIWLIFPHKASGKKRIPYNDAVEEALCFGWIDSTVRSFDEESSMQRFTPRRSGSTYSQPNKERIKWLAENNLLHPSITEGVEDIIRETYVFPPDILEELKKDKTVWENFRQFSEPYKRIRVAYIDDARPRPEEFAKRLKNFIAKTKQNKQIGYGGIEKFY